MGLFFLEIWGHMGYFGGIECQGHRGGLDTRNGGLLPGMPQARALTKPLSHSPEPGDEGDPGRSGLELEPEEPPGWRELVPPGTLHSLPKSQVKRQEVISGEYPSLHPLWPATQPSSAEETGVGRCPPGGQ